MWIPVSSLAAIVLPQWAVLLNCDPKCVANATEEKNQSQILFVFDPPEHRRFEKTKPGGETGL